MAAHSARTQHRMAVELMASFATTAEHVSDTVMAMLLDALEDKASLSHNCTQKKNTTTKKTRFELFV